MSDEKMTRDALLAQMEAGWQRLMSYLMSLRMDQVLGPTDAAGWTIKDHIMHLAVWAEGVNALLEGKSRLAAMGVDQATWDSSDYDLINAVIQQANRDLSIETVRSRITHAHERMVEHVGGMSDDDLYLPYNHFDPSASRTYPIIDLIAADNFEHYVEHIPWMDVIANSGRMSRDSLVAHLRDAYQELEAYLETLSDDQLTDPTDAAGWTVKDHLIHLAVWENGITALLKRQPRIAAMGVDEATWNGHDYDAINAVIQQANRDLPLNMVRESLKQAHEDMIATLNRLSDDDIHRPYGDYDPSEPGGEAVINYIMGNSAGHYAEHQPWIDAIARSGRLNKAALLDQMQAAYDDLQAYLTTLTDAQMTEPTDEGGWTIKDHLVHLADWHNSLTCLWEGKPRYEGMGVDAETWAAGLEPVNAAAQQNSRDLPLDEARQKLESAYNKVVATVNGLSDDDLYRPTSNFNPTTNSRRPFVAWVGSNTYGHYASHRPWIDTLARSGRMTKAQLLDKMRAGYEEFQAYLATLTDRQLTEPTDDAGWTAKDHLIHMAVWAERVIKMMDGVTTADALGVPPQVWAARDVDAINAVIQQANRDLPLDEVRRRLADSYAGLVAIVQEMSDDDLYRPFRDFDSSSQSRRPFILWFEGDTYEHYSEHQPWIDAIAKRVDA